MSADRNDPLPRRTKLFDDQQRMITPELDRMLADRELWPLFDDLARSVSGWLKDGDVDPRPELTKVDRAVKESYPLLAHVFGDHLQDWLLQFACIDIVVASELDEGHDPGVAVREAARRAPRLRMARFGPDNPIRIMSDDGSSTEGASEETRHYLQIRDYVRAMRPARRPGRPPGARAKNGGDKSRAIDPEKAVRAREMRQQGKKSHEIARELWPDIDPYSDKARKRATRAIERANLDHPI